MLIFCLCFLFFYIFFLNFSDFCPTNYLNIYPVPIFGRLVGLVVVELWLSDYQLKLVFRSLVGLYHGNLFFVGLIGRTESDHKTERFSFGDIRKMAVAHEKSRPTAASSAGSRLK